MKLEDFNDLEVTTYDPVGHCIYCGSVEDLSDEHIVPYGLNSPCRLPAASCRRCRRITGRFEGKVLRGPMWLVRAKLRFRSRRREQYPTTGELIVVRGKVEEAIELPLEEYPLLLHFPVFAPPTSISGEAEVQGIQIRGIATIGFGQDPEEVKRRLGADDIKVTQNYEYVAFARMVAKIAFSMAAAIGSLDLLDRPSPVLPAILGERRDIGHWVGTYTDPLEAVPRLLHLITVYRDEDRRLLMGKVKLFADSPSPTYGVVLGKLKEGG